MIKPEGEILFQLLLDQTFDAAANGDYRIVREMLGIEVVFPDGKPRKITANSLGENNGTLLQMAAGCDHFAIVDLLLARGADVRAKDDQNDTALHQAAITGANRCARALLNAGADPSAQNISGRTPLHFAIMQGNSNMALLLLENGADPHIKNCHGMTPLMTDFIHGQGKLVRAVINVANNKNIVLNLDLPAADGKTLLHMAAKKGLPCAIADLLMAGANPLLRDKDGKKPLDLSYENYNDEAIALLLRAEVEYKKIMEGQMRQSHAKSLERLNRLPETRRARENWERRKKEQKKFP